MRKRLEVKIFGDVQGVNFRRFVKKEADHLGMTGWVRNEEDGSIRIVAEGDEERLRKFVALLRHGPRYARVNRIEETHEDTHSEFNSFEVRY